MDLLMLMLGNIWRLLVPKKGKYGSGLKYYSNEIINQCYISSVGGLLTSLGAEALKQKGKQVCPKYNT